MLGPAILQTNAIVSSVRTGKNGKIYCDFLLMGGSITVLIDPNDEIFLNEKIGSEIPITLLTRPRQIVNFGRSVTVFEPITVSRSKR